MYAAPDQQHCCSHQQTILMLKEDSFKVVSELNRSQTVLMLKEDTFKL